MDSKAKYRDLCEQRDDIPLFMQAWWLDAVCNAEGKYWDVLLVEDNSRILGAMPYHLQKKMGFKLIMQPMHTQFSGVWFNYSGSNIFREKICFEREVISKIIHQLSNLKVSFFLQNFHYSLTNWQPFYWKGYKQTTRYTYILNNIENTEAVFGNFHSLKQKHIKKAERDLHIDYNTDASQFYQFHKETLSLQNKQIFYSEKLFKSIHASCCQRQQAKIIAIRDNKNNLHAAAFIVWDKQASYYLISAIHPAYKSSGASSLMVWEAIRFLSGKTKVFDFEGSMIEGVARSFEEFGAEPKPYFAISKINLLFKLYLKFRKM